MKNVTKKGIKELVFTPENVSGGCMTGRILTAAGTKKISSFISQYKANKKVSSTTKVKS